MLVSMFEGVLFVCRQIFFIYKEKNSNMVATEIFKHVMCYVIRDRGVVGSRLA